MNMPYHYYRVPNSWHNHNQRYKDPDALNRNHTVDLSKESEVPEIVEVNIYVGNNQNCLEHIQKIPVKSNISSKASIYPEAPSYTRKREFLQSVKHSTVGWNSLDWRGIRRETKPSMKKSVSFSSDTVFFERNPNSVFWKTINERKQLRLAIKKRRQQFREKKKCSFFEAIKFGFSKNSTNSKYNPERDEIKSKDRRTISYETRRVDDSLSQLFLRSFTVR